MFIEVEKTYNENVQNFYFGINVLDFMQAEYADQKSKDASDFLKSILKIKGVEKALLLPDMLFVQKTKEADFFCVAPQVMAEIDAFDFLKFKDFDFSKQDKYNQICALTEAKIRPFLKADGGDIEILSLQNNVVNVRLKGHCSGCVHANKTLKNMVEKNIKKYIDENISVQEEA